ncbi:MAG: hypothetical protein ACRDZ3_12490 [Acidimicrobiia bacterium]
MSFVVLDASAAVEVFLGTPEGKRLSAKVPKNSTAHCPNTSTSRTPPSSDGWKSQAP